MLLTDAHFGYRRDSTRGDVTLDKRDSARVVPKCRVVGSGFTWGGERLPNVPWSQTVIYELHVKGYTKLHPDVPAPHRGTFAGLGAPAVIDHLVRLGVTAIELLPIHPIVDEQHLISRSLRNYWGYSSINFFAADDRFVGGDRAHEFRTMVANLHAAGIEVSWMSSTTTPPRATSSARRFPFAASTMRPTTCLSPTSGSTQTLPAAAIRSTCGIRGCWTDGHGLPAVLGAGDARRRLPLRSGDDAGAGAAWLRFGRGIPLTRFSADSGAVAGEDDRRAVGHRLRRLSGWQLPARLELERSLPANSDRRYRRGDTHLVGELAGRLTGSSDLFQRGGRGRASISATAHDGFTLHDLVSYEHNAMALTIT